MLNSDRTELNKSDPFYRWWPENYFASREAFIEQAKACSAQLDSVKVPSVGPGGENLFVDVASLISDQDDHRIIITSGLHGVEGFIGASIQIQALRKLNLSSIPEHIGIILIHAVNPYGFAHLRRVDENNIDVNRNFIDFDHVTPTTHPEYETLDPAINPRIEPSFSCELKYWLSAGKHMLRHRGIAQLAEPIAEGQGEYPHGLFFTGLASSPSTTVLQKLIREYSVSADQVTVLDVHSGLGPSGTATLIGNTNLANKERQASGLESYYQQSVVLDDASENAYTAQGNFGQWCKREFNDKRFLYLCVEIGTVNPLVLFSALRRENQAHHWSAKNSGTYDQTKRKLLDVFAPPSLHWRTKATAQGLQVVERTFELPTNF